MRTAKELKEVAVKAGLEFETSWNAQKMQALLDSAGIGEQGEELIDPRKDVGDNSRVIDLGVKFRELTGDYEKADRIDDKYVKQMKRRDALLEINAIKSELRELNATNSVTAILRWESQHQMLDLQDDYELNMIEESECEHSCECVAKLNAGGRYSLGDMYKYKKQYDELRKSYVYIMYIHRTKAPNEQITPEIEAKLDMGYLARDLVNEYPKEKRLVRKDSLVESEWKRYFRHIDK
jgi:hypothetical protein